MKDKLKNIKVLAKNLIKAIKLNTCGSEIDFEDGKELMPVVPIQYIEKNYGVL